MAFEELKEKLEHNGFEVSVFNTKEEAADYLDKSIDNTTVGCGGSVTVEELGIIPRLARHNTIYSHSLGGDRQEIMNNAMTADVYLMSANAIAEKTGEILNIDGIGNRASSSLFGHRKVYMVAGKNKVSHDYNSAYWRLRNVVAPKNAARLKRKTPCALKADKCYNCDSPERICNGLVVHYKKMGNMDIEIILIDEELGF